MKKQGFSEILRNSLALDFLDLLINTNYYTRTNFHKKENQQNAFLLSSDAATGCVL